MLFAMKVIKKRFIEQRKKLSQVAIERRVMGSLRHPFIVKLHWAFQSVILNQPEDLCFVMDFCPGGELFFHLHRLGRFSEAQAKFYFSEVLLALEHLHSSDIVYRDLKPENILLDIDGHIRLADFGLAKDQMRDEVLSYSFCGSPEYMCPEMLNRKGHDKAVDFYSLGALLYEMLTGLPPFYSEDQAKMYDDIKGAPLCMPPYLSISAKSVLYGLLCKSPGERLGAKYGIEEIKAHPWCDKVKWDILLMRKIKPPYRPSLRSSNFEAQYTELSIEDESLGEGQDLPGFDFDQNEFDRVLLDTERLPRLYSQSKRYDFKATLESEQLPDLGQAPHTDDTARTWLSLPTSELKPIKIKEVRTSSAVLRSSDYLIPISPSKLLQANKSSALVMKPRILCASILSPAGGHFTSVKIQAKQEPVKVLKKRSLSKANRPKSRNL